MMHENAEKRDEDDNVEDDYHENNEKDGCDEDDDYADGASIN